MTKYYIRKQRRSLLKGPRTHSLKNKRCHAPFFVSPSLGFVTSLTLFFSTGIDRHKLASRSNPCDHITYTAHMSRCRLSGRAVDCHDTGSVDCHAGTCPRHLANSLLSLPLLIFQWLSVKTCFKPNLANFIILFSVTFSCSESSVQFPLIMT